jgi:hypothetical protein
MAGADGGNNTLKYVGIGCGVLFLLSCLCSGGWWALSMAMATSGGY